MLLDADLAALYGVDTRRLNEQVRRNRDRFPQDFIFELTRDEYANLKSQFATSSLIAGNDEPASHGGRRKLPMAFTEHGAIMAATVLSSPRAVEVSVYVVRAFLKLRELVATHQGLAKRLDALEARLEEKTESLAMAAMVLNSPRAVQVSLYVVRAFVRLREAALQHKDLAQQLAELQDKTESLAMSHETFSRNTRNQLKQVFDTLRELVTPPEPHKWPIGFVTPQDKSTPKAKAKALSIAKKTAAVKAVRKK